MLTKSIVALILALSITRLTAAETPTSDPLLWWKAGVLSGLRVRMQVCDERYPEYTNANLTAYQASVFYEPTVDLAIRAGSSEASANSFIEQTSEAQERAKRVLLELSSAELKTLCANYAASVAAQQNKIFGGNASEAKAKAQGRAGSNAP